MKIRFALSVVLMLVGLAGVVISVGWFAGLVVALCGVGAAIGIYFGARSAVREAEEELDQLLAKADRMSAETDRLLAEVQRSIIETEQLLAAAKQLKS